MSHRVSPFQPRRLVLAVLLAELAVGVAVPALAQTGAARLPIATSPYCPRCW